MCGQFEKSNPRRYRVALLSLDANGDIRDGVEVDVRTRSVAAQLAFAEQDFVRVAARATSDDPEYSAPYSEITTDVEPSDEQPGEICFSLELGPMPDGGSHVAEVYPVPDDGKEYPSSLDSVLYVAQMAGAKVRRGVSPVTGKLGYETYLPNDSDSFGGAAAFAAMVMGAYPIDGRSEPR